MSGVDPLIDIDPIVGAEPATADIEPSALIKPKEPATSGRLFGLGVSPGDPELITVKALRRLRECEDIAYYAGPRKHGNALAIFECWLRDDQQRLPLIYPVTGRPPPPSFDYEGTMRAFYDASAERVAEQLSAGRDVATLCEGDPLFYGSFMYLHDRLAERFETEVVPGVCSVVASTSVLQTPLVYRDQTLLVLAGTLPEVDLERMLASAQAAAIMKLGSNFAKVRRVIMALGLGDRALYVERATMTNEQIRPLAEVDPEQVPYFSMILVPGER